MCSWSKIIKTKGSNKIIWPFFWIILFFAVDRLAKILSLRFLSDEGVFVIPNILGLVLERNQGIAYSIPLTGIYLVVVLIIIVMALVAVAVKAYRKKEINVVISIGLIIPGAVSNLFDRLQYGYVVDMLVLTKWPVFNIADLMILAGGIWLIIIYLQKK
ncbi:MAG: signal peptidase II [candidate division Zixibacteria bacterium]|nr:signal peptidase II [candidate division Zixibacteria bacterium]